MTGHYYSLQKRKHKNEFHLFQGGEVNGKMKYNSSSFCDQLDMEGSEIVLIDLKEDQARIKCANGGKQVCGACVSYLYSDFK